MTLVVGSMHSIAKGNAGRRAARTDLSLRTWAAGGEPSEAGAVAMATEHPGSGDPISAAARGNGTLARVGIRDEKMSSQQGTYGNVACRE